MSPSIEEVAERARSLATRLYGRWSEQDRDDLVQDVLVRYVRTFGEHDAPENLSAWLTTVIRNTARNLHAQNERRLEDPQAVDDPVGAFAAAVSPSFASLVPVQEELLRSVLGLLDDERTRAVLRMKYVDNLTSRRIADELGLSPNAVDQIASRGKRRLAEALESRPDLVKEMASLHPRNY